MQKLEYHLGNTLKLMQRSSLSIATEFNYRRRQKKKIWGPRGEELVIRQQKTGGGITQSSRGERSSGIKERGLVVKETNF